MQPKFINRLTREFNKIDTNPKCRYKVELVNGNIQHWIATIPGPEDTPYEGLSFKLSIDVTEKWPFEPPQFKFITKVFHPNVWPDGKICLDVNNSGGYSAAMDMEGRLDNLTILLQEPNCSSPANGEASHMWGKSGFREKAAQWAKQ